MSIPADFQAELTAHAPAGMTALTIRDDDTEAIIRAVWRGENFDFVWNCVTPASNAAELARLHVFCTQAVLFPNG